MMQSKTPPNPNDAIKGCPSCGHYDDIFRLYPNHWAVCHEHNLCWHIGTDPKDVAPQPEDEWYENLGLLSKYRRVKP